MLFLSLFLACGTGEPEDPSPLVADPTSTAAPVVETTAVETPQESSGHALLIDSWELAILEPQLEDIRKGVQLSGPDGLGICEQDPEDQGCAQFLGRNPELLPEGKFFFRAILTAPRESTGWKVEFSYECKLTHPDGRIQEIKPGPQTREIKYRGGTPSTHRLSSFKAPSAEGDRACTYTLVSLRNDGKETGRYSGSYFIPGS